MGSALSRRDSGYPMRLVLAVGATVLAVILLVMPRYGLPDPGATLIWGLPSGPTAHVVVMGGAAFLWGRVFSDVQLWRLVVWGTLFALCAEALQLLPFVDRGVDWEDVWFNLLGVGVGGLLAMASRTPGMLAGGGPVAEPQAGEGKRPTWRGPSRRSL